MRAKNVIFCILVEISSFNQIYARAGARAGARMPKIKKYGLSAFSGKKMKYFGFVVRILDNFEIAHKIQKKVPFHVPTCVSHHAWNPNVLSFG